MSIVWDDVMKFELPSNAVIFDVGGYHGDWAQIAIARYPDSEIYVFEPVQEFYEGIKKRFANNSKVKVFNFGLSGEDRIDTINIRGDGSSTFGTGEQKEQIQLKSISNFAIENKIFKVDLIKINIEGEEYLLLEKLTKSNELTIFNNLLIQFHSFVDNCEEKRQNIVNELDKYYDNIFNYEFVFEGWSLKKIKETHCIGDSHVSIFSDSTDLIDDTKLVIFKNFHCYRMGPTLAHSLPDKANIIQYANSIPEDVQITYLFGEIDCRAQVHNRITQTEDYKVVIDKIAERYFIFLREVSKHNNNIITFSVTPELKEQPHWYYYGINPQVFDCPRGTYAERRMYKEFFNNRIKEESEKAGWKHISIYEHLVEPDKTKDAYFLDDIHLLPKNVTYLIQREFLKNELYC